MKSVGDKDVFPGWDQHTLDIFCPTKATIMFSIFHLNLSASLSFNKIEGIPTKFVVSWEPLRCEIKPSQNGISLKQKLWKLHSYF